jgi:inorganic triphosphatase YgiF
MSKKEQEKAIEDTKKVAEQAKSAEDKLDAAETLQEVGQQAATQEIQQTYRRSLDETKANVRKSIDEARTQIPKYTNVVNSYQEQALESTGKMVEDYVNTQKSVMDSVFSSTSPYYENAYRMYSYWFSPRVPAELWARYVSNVVENISATARINNEVLFENIDAWRNVFERAQQHTQELSRINTNAVRAFENTARETAAEFSVGNRQRELYL